VWLFALVFPNVGYMGIPLIEAMYGAGSDAMFYVTACNIVFNFCAFTLGIRLIGMSGEGGRVTWRSILLNISILASFAGVLCYLLGIRVPAPVLSSLNSLGNMTTPLSMLIIGAVLAASPIRDILSDWTVCLVSLLRLFALPALAFLVLRPFIADKTVLDVLVVLAATPVGVMTTVFSVRYRANVALSSRMVFVSTVLSIVTIPVCAALFT